MSIFSLTQFLNLEAFLTWDLVRGISQTYDMPAQVPSSSGDTGWSIENAPTGFSIDSSGVVTADLSHHFSDSVNTLMIETDQSNYNLDFRVSDYFPSDFYKDPTMFCSSFRSWDRTERDLYRCRYVSGETPSVFATQEVTVRSGADGYLDQAALQTTLAAIGARGVLEPIIIYNQIDNHNDATLKLNAGSDAVLAGFMNDGVLEMVVQNDMPVFRGGWTPSSLNSNFTLPARSDVLYRNPGTTHYETFGVYHAMVISLRRHVTTTPKFWGGDRNAYPGLRVDGNVFDSNNGADPTPITLTNAQIGEWGVWNSRNGRHQIISNQDTTQRREHFWRQLDSNLKLTGAPTYVADYSIQLRGGSGVSIDMGDWDWAEMSAYDGLETFAKAEVYRGQDVNLYNNLVAVLGGGSFEYS